MWYSVETIVCKRSGVDCEKMGKMRAGMVILVCALLVGCTGGENTGDVDERRNVEWEENEAGENETEESGNVEKEVEGGIAEQGELVSAAVFAEYYGMEKGEVPVDYLEEFIEHRQLTEDSLSERNYDAMVRELYERGVTFGSSAAELIAGKRTELSEEDDFSDVAYVVLQKDVYEAGTDMAKAQITVLEVENRKVYSGMDINDDYTVAKDVKEFSEEAVGECLLGLRDIITEDWNTYHSVEGKEYDWKLHIVKKDGAVISFSGEGPDEEWNRGFMQWCEDYME